MRAALFMSFILSATLAQANMCSPTFQADTDYTLLLDISSPRQGDNQVIIQGGITISENCVDWNPFIIWYPTDREVTTTLWQNGLPNTETTTQTMRIDVDTSMVTLYDCNKVAYAYVEKGTRAIRRHNTTLFVSHTIYNTAGKIIAYIAPSVNNTSLLFDTTGNSIGSAISITPPNTVSSAAFKVRTNGSIDPAIFPTVIALDLINTAPASTCSPENAQKISGIFWGSAVLILGASIIGTLYAYTIHKRELPGDTQV